MAGRVPAIHGSDAATKDVGARDKSLDLRSNLSLSSPPRKPAFAGPTRQRVQSECIMLKPGHDE
jgi:hypothetical protein